MKKLSEELTELSIRLYEIDKRIPRTAIHKNVKRWFMVMGCGLETLRDAVEQLEKANLLLVPLKDGIRPVKNISQGKEHIAGVGEQG